MNTQTNDTNNTPAHPTPSAMYGRIVDRLAAVKAQIAAMQEEEKALRAVLADSGLRTILGTTHRASIAPCDGRITIDWQTIAQRLHPSHQLITAHTTQGESYTSVRLFAHKTS